jgi:hypothetical protein
MPKPIPYCYFGEVKVGGTFHPVGRSGHFIKITLILYARPGRTEKRGNAVNLETGRVCFFHNGQYGSSNDLE